MIHFLGYFYKRNSLVGVLNVYLRQVKVEEHRSGQGQVIKGQLSYSYENSRVIHLFRYFLKRNSLHLVSSLYFTVFRDKCIGHLVQVRSQMVNFALKHVYSINCLNWKIPNIFE